MHISKNGCGGPTAIICIEDVSRKYYRWLAEIFMYTILQPYITRKFKTLNSGFFFDEQNSKICKI